MVHLRDVYNSVHDRAHKHHSVFQQTTRVFHLGYFTLVMTHGPYHIAAGGLLIIGIIVWILQLDTEV